MVDDDLLTLLDKYDEPMLTEAAARVEKYLSSEEGRQKVLEDKAGRYFINGATMVTVLSAAAGLLLKSGEGVTDLPLYYSLMAALAMFAISNLVTSAWAARCFEIKTTEGLNLSDMVPKDPAVYQSKKQYLVFQVHNMVVTARSLYAMNEERAKHVADTEAVAFKGISLTAVSTVLLVTWALIKALQGEGGSS